MALLRAAQRLEDCGVKIVLWREPDLDNQVTSFGTEILRGERRRLARFLQTLREPTAQGESS